MEDITTTLYPFNDLFSRTSWVSWHHKNGTILDFTEARDDGWQWHQLGHMQIICTSLQTTMPIPHHSVITGWMPFLPDGRYNIITILYCILY